jgi:hypothetical protein
VNIGTTTPPAERRHRRRSRRVAEIAVATAVAASCGATIGPATPALAGGAPGPYCAAGARTDIPADGPAAAGRAARVEGGFYAMTGLFWPPTTAILCQEPPNTHHPLFRAGRGGCATGTTPFLIPDDLGPTVAGSPPLWGTFLPPGWYYLGNDAPPGWSDVCWSVTKPAATI